MLACGVADHVVGWLRRFRGGAASGDVKYTSLVDRGSIGLERSSWSQRYLTWYRKHIGTPALFGYRHVQAAWGGWASLPTRLESIIVSGSSGTNGADQQIGIYIAANVLFTLCPYPMAPENRL